MRALFVAEPLDYLLVSPLTIQLPSEHNVSPRYTDLSLPQLQKRSVSE